MIYLYQARSVFDPLARLTPNKTKVTIRRNAHVSSTTDEFLDNDGLSDEDSKTGIGLLIYNIDMLYFHVLFLIFLSICFFNIITPQVIRPLKMIFSCLQVVLIRVAVFTVIFDLPQDFLA